MPPLYAVVHVPVQVNLCLPNPCKNSATCRSLSATDYNCTCRAGFFGKNCDVSCCPCAMFWSACSGHRIHFKCLASPTSTRAMHLQHRVASMPWKGSLPPLYAVVHVPVQVNLCLSNPCQNLATCRSLSEIDYNCTCRTGFYGKNCQVRL